MWTSTAYFSVHNALSLTEAVTFFCLSVAHAMSHARFVAAICRSLTLCASLLLSHFPCRRPFHLTFHLATQPASQIAIIGMSNSLPVNQLGFTLDYSGIRSCYLLNVATCIKKGVFFPSRLSFEEQDFMQLAREHELLCLANMQFAVWKSYQSSIVSQNEIRSGELKGMSVMCTVIWRTGKLNLFRRPSEMFCVRDYDSLGGGALLESASLDKSRLDKCLAMILVGRASYLLFLLPCHLSFFPPNPPIRRMRVPKLWCAATSRLLYSTILSSKWHPATAVGHS